MKDVPKNFEISSTTTKLKLTVEKIFYPKAKNEKLFSSCVELRKKGAEITEAEFSKEYSE